MHSPHPGYLRNERVSELIRKELGELILRELEFDGAIMTIVEVDVTKKIDYARVHVSVIPSSAPADAKAMAGKKATEGKPSSELEKSVLKVLNSRRRELQSLLLRKINIRPMPELQFLLDHGTEKAAKIEKVFIEEKKAGELSGQ